LGDTRNLRPTGLKSSTVAHRNDRYHKRANAHSVSINGWSKFKTLRRVSLYHVLQRLPLYIPS